MSFSCTVEVALMCFSSVRLSRIAEQINGPPETQAVAPDKCRCSCSCCQGLMVRRAVLLSCAAECLFLSNSRSC